MLRIRDRLSTPSQDGMTLIEVVVAMMVFAIIALGIAQSMVSVLTLTRESRSRTVAMNLAAQEIDAVRSVENVFDIVGDPDDETVDGVLYRIMRTTVWVDSSGNATGCETDGTALQHLQVRVEVEWGNEESATPVVSETIIAPKTKINDPTRGTILVKVTDALGQPTPDMPVTAVKSVGGETLPTPDPTDAQGCTYVLLVAPGTYKVGVLKPGYVDNFQATAPQDTAVVVTAGESTAVTFQYDRASKIKLNLASNRGTFAPKLPISLDVSLFSANPMYQPALSGTGYTREYSVHPALAGYEILTGKFASPTEASAGCLSVDPLEWPNERGGVPTLATRAGPADASAGGSSVRDVPMALVKITAKGLGTTAKKTLKAVSAEAASYPGEPGCAQPMSYSFGAILPSDGSTVVALPYGSWKLSNSNGIFGAFTGTTVEVLTGGMVAPDGTVTLDPREDAP